MKYIVLTSLIFSHACTTSQPKGTDLENNDFIDSGDNSEENITNEPVDIPEFSIGVSTLAGSGEYGSVDGTGVAVTFAEPKTLTMRNDNILIVVDSGTGAVRELQLDGTARTRYLAGPTPVAPSGVAVTESGIIYISDYAEHCIYKVESDVSSVFAGTCGVNGFRDGTSALFDLPRGLDLDAEENLIVADAHNFRIRSITPDGEVSTIAGSGEAYAGSSEGPVDEADIYIPFGVAVHNSGDIYISGFDHCIRRIHNGRVENIAGLCRNYSNTGNTDGSPIDARFDHPLDIAFGPDDSLYIADSFNDRIRKLSSDLSTVETISGTEAGYLDGAHDEAMFDVPRGIHVGPEGNIYVADSVNNRIRVVTPK